MRFAVITLALTLACGKVFAADCLTKGRIVYADDGDRALKLTLRLPDDSGTELRPAVLLVHGGAWLFGTRHQLHWYGKRLAENGYVTAAISYRMMPDYPFPACLHDAKAAVRWLRLHAKEYRIDPNRIAVLGNSAGGHIAAMLAATRPEDNLEGTQNLGASSAVQAAIVMYGVTDLSYYKNPRGYIGLGGLAKTFMKSFVGTDAKGKTDPYAAGSPDTYVHEGMCPVLLVHGTKDHQVPYRQSVAFSDRLDAVHVSEQFITVPYGHAFDFFHPKARDEFFAQALTFLNTRLKPLEPAAQPK